MKFLLFLLGITFFFIFFILSSLSDSKESLVNNIYIEAHIYIIISLILIVKVFKNDFHKKSRNKEDSKTIFPKVTFSWSFMFSLIRLFFWKYIYYIACSFFYISLFLILKVLLWETDIPKMFLFFNLLVLSLYFFEHKFQLFQDFIRVNTIIVSLYYTLFQLSYLIGWTEWFSLADMLNIVLLFVLFFFLLYSSRKKKYIPVISSYVVVFIFLEYCVFLKYFFESLNYWISILSFFLSVIFLWKSQFFHKKLYIPNALVRVWGLISSYIYIYFSSFLILSSSSYSFLLILGTLIISIVLYDFHAKFQNYISLLIASLWFLVAWYGGYLLFMPTVFVKDYLFVMFFAIALVFLFIERVYINSYIYDIYFFRVFSMLVNICWVISFLLFWESSILSSGVLLFGESLYFFFSYYSLRNNTLKW